MKGMKGLTFQLLFAISAAALGSGWQHGYATAVINVPEVVIKNWMKETPTGKGNPDGINALFGSMNGVFCVGGILGGIISGLLADWLGRKWTLILNNILVAIAGIIQLFLIQINQLEVLIFTRFVQGVNAGINAGVCPMYCCEMSPLNLRGAMGSAYQFVIVVSILVAQVLGSKSIMGTESAWPYLLAFILIPAIYQVVTLIFCYESPKYLLLKKGDEEKAQKALKWLRKDDDAVAEDMAELKSEAAGMASRPKIKFSQYCSERHLRIPLIIGIVLMLGQQWSGINAIIFYSTNILTNENDPIDLDPQTGTMIIGAVNLLTTIVAVVLVEIAGRKTLLLTAFVGLTIITAGVGIVYLVPEFGGITAVVLTLICLYIVLFAIGAGAIPWFIMSELFQQEARSNAAAIACAVNWAANAVVGFTFPLLKEAVGNYVFWFYVIALALMVVFVLLFVPETKGKPVEEIVEKFKGNPPPPTAQ